MRPFPRQRILAVVFDLDNTLIKSKIGEKKGLVIAARLISKQLKKRGQNYGYHIFLERLKVLNREMLGWKQRYNRDLWWKTMISELHLKKLSTEFVHKTTLRYWEAYGNGSLPFSDAESTVRKLKNLGYKLGVVSDSDGTPGMKLSRFKRLAFHLLFQIIVVAGEDTPRVKPGHEAFRLIAKRLRVDPRNCVYVGDNPRTDISGARAVGMTTVIVKRRGNDQGKPDYRVNSLREIPRLLSSLY
ncbi:MAG TPA: HAD-IIIA family hydrolase [Candidatus Bathyarchaeia archaeon]|nr:HAD-IIIA family hydrolase [Candidatus Bathyarchaeia archaeon]